MELAQILADAKESIGATAVYGQPYEKNGVTVIPAAQFMGGGGGGQGQMTQGSEAEDTGESTTMPTGSGGGFGTSGKPTGAFVITGDNVRWIPAVDVNRLVFGFQVVLVVLFVAMRSIAKSRSTATR